MKLRLFFLLCVFSIASPSAIVPGPGFSQNAESLEWLKLLHYRKNAFGNSVSDADGKEFFVHPEGRTNPAAELEAFTTALLHPNPSLLARDLSPACRFPARAAYVAKQWGVALPFCPKLEAYRASAVVSSVAVVFSSYYLNHPSSAFGHTFLRLNRQKGSELLDDGVSFAANTAETNPFFYAMGGIFGAFPGTFSRLPYFYKVREYSDIESRDLWSYELDLDPEEVQRLVDHLWELGQTHFDYFFLTENCSFHLLTAIEAAAPRLDLVSRLPGVVVPADTLRSLTSVPGLIRSLAFRPSLRRRWEDRWKNLDETEKSAFTLLTQTRDLKILSSLPVAAQRQVLDTAIDAVDTVQYRELVMEPKSEASQWKHGLLRARAPLGRSEMSETSLSLVEAPHLGHGVQRWGVTSGAGTAGGFVGLRFRLALHDLVDHPRGYPELTTLEFLDTELRMDFTRGKPSVERASFVRAVQLNPWNALQNRLSWSFDLGMETLHEGVDIRRAAALRAGGGITFSLADKIQVFGLLETGAQAGEFKAHWNNLFVGPRIGVRVQLPYGVRALLSVFPHWNTHRTSAYYLSHSSELSVPLQSDWALRFRILSEGAWSEVSAGAYLYF